MTLEIYESRDALIAAAQARIESALKEAISQRGRAGMFLSGGSTPGPIYDALSNVDLDWENVVVGLADERWVAPDNSASNEALARKTLLKNKAAQATFLPMKTEHDTAAESVVVLDKSYAAFEGCSDILILGMGPDGHSLSWFPGADGLEMAMNPENERRVAAIMANRSDVTGDNLERMTLTARCVAEAGHVILLITGAIKKDVLENGDQALPIRTVEALSEGRLTVMWAE